MTCKETERLIQQYLNGELDERKTKVYLKHIKQCKACYEEMEITYMSTIGLERLESGASIDIGKEMEKLLQQSEKRLKKRTVIKISGVVLDAIAMIIVVFTLFLQITIWITKEVPVLKETIIFSGLKEERSE